MMHRTGRLASIMFTLFLVLASLLPVLPDGGRVAAAANPAPVDDRPGRTQAGVQAAGSLVVWEDRAVAARPALESVAGSSDIRGPDLATGQPFVVTAAPGDQTAPAIAGTIVVWQDTGHSCPGCEADIRGQDLATGAEFVIAAGPADQAAPTVAGRTIAWIEFDGGRQRLLTTELGGQQVVEIAVAAPGATLGRPAMSDDLIVWAEHSPSGTARRQVLSAYQRATGQVQRLTEVTWPGLEYAVADQRVVWTEPRLVLADVVTGAVAVLDTGPAAAPAIAGDLVVWSGLDTRSADGHDIYGFELATGQRLRLVAAAGSQRRPVVAGDRLVWQSEEDGRSRLLTTILAEARAGGQTASAESRLAATTTDSLPLSAATLDTTALSATTTDMTALSHTASFTRPTYKGMHAANGQGWTCTAADVCPAIDALGAPEAPYFGSVVVLNSDLGRPTGYLESSPWGPTVAHAMRHMQTTYGVRVIVRIFPTLSPNPDGSVSPDSAAQQVVELAKRYDWVRHVQVHNEPNLEWPASCSNCRWQMDKKWRSYTWSSIFDYRLYQAINSFYTDVHAQVARYRSSYPDRTVRTRLQQMELWTPPLSDFYRTLDNGANFYAYLHGMIDRYDRLTYHTYPAPNYDSDGAGGIINNSWPWFDDWLRTNISSGAVRSMITEFGWNPGQMSWCDARQYEAWPTTTGCAPNDGQTHTFEKDVSRFLAAHRHGAEVVAVWIVRGWNDAADGLDGAGTPRGWFHAYQYSSP